MDNQLTILQAAVRTGDGVIHTLPRPNRHHDIIRLMAAMGHPQCGCCNDGFLLSDGRFASRSAAKRIAFLAGQVRRGRTISETMTSEDLW